MENLKEITLPNREESCPCCEAAVIYNNERPPHNINIKATCDEIIKRCASKEMSVIRGDCPLDLMLDLLAADTVYTIVQFLQCNVCGKTIFWGLCIRGAPIYKTVERHEADSWPWEDKSKYWLKLRSTED